MINSISTTTLFIQLATVSRVIHLKSSLPPMLFAGIGGFKARIAQQTKPTAKINVINNTEISLYANNIFAKRTHQQRDTDDEHDTKSCCCNTNSADVRNGWDRCGKGRVEDFGRDVLVCNRLAEYIQRGGIVSDGTEETGRPGRSRAQRENGGGLDKCHGKEWLYWATQLSFWQGCHSTVLYNTNGRG